jgi:UDPglucose 6-dehydrogenase
MPNVKAKVGDKVRYAEDFMAACDGADALLIATEWPQYAAADLEVAASRLKEKLMFDGRNLFEPETMRAKGWNYHSIGRMPVGLAKIPREVSQ